MDTWRRRGKLLQAREKVQAKAGSKGRAGLLQPTGDECGLGRAFPLRRRERKGWLDGSRPVGPVEGRGAAGQGLLPADGQSRAAP